MATKSLPKGYEPEEVESRWREFWIENKTFTPDMDAEGEPYSIVIPPPNVTGQLHIGHALNLTLQDILCRHARQLGKKVLWVPGMDHAGIATQNVVERKLATEDLTREDLGREKFIERVWEWKEEYGGKILNQIRHMGASVDWTRERFTMDEGLSRAVRQVFVRLYEEGLIYKGDYIINWCNRCHTALADDEVEHAAHKGHLYHIRYPLSDGSGDLIIATTRPETMLADTAIAVHPEDDRFNEHIGKYAVLPVIGRKLIVIGDKYVDREFGTGCLKVTPAHDMNDWELGRKHNLETMSVFTDEGKLNDNAPEEFRGLGIIEAREKIVKLLEEQGHLVKIEEHDHNVGECYRCKNVVEPHVSTQWFVAVKPLAEKAGEAVTSGKTRILPATWEKTYFHWLDNIRDWCISRQLWWGHRIPAWTCEECGELIVPREDPECCPKCGGPVVQDEDVLDTWFSSALWPFSTMGWPDETEELKAFYPTSCLVTGFDILFFWVARMMMMGIQFMDNVPFNDVYIHALVRDAEGKKMSKSTGNVIDPILMCDKYGTDSLRFTLTAFAAMGRDIKLSEDRIEGYRHFMNKIWNAARFAMMNLPDEAPKADLADAKAVYHRWMLSRLEEMKDEMAESIAAYRFNDAAQGIYKFTWNEFCDWYLELIKGDLNGDDEQAKAVAQTVLYTALTEILTLAHPIMPFITQEIYATLPGKDGANLAAELYPERRPELLDKSVAGQMELLTGVITSVRTIRAELNIKPSLELELLVKTACDEDAAFILEHQDLIRSLARVGSVSAGAEVEGPKASASNVVMGNELFVPLTGAVDFDAELARLDKEMGKIEKTLGGVEKKLSNKGFTDKAPAEVVEGERAKAVMFREKLDKLSDLRKRLADAAGN
ncbi:valine--tRNA ligase [Desulfovibrio ferrophilus]|uniref:Valine--tRNA ligase n=1 Tax=Desulfovibrio ferrophilus TaxID=241368 RepID=A0A2Z6B307_9BACT|nr:valine--tRNA ligase [Desulfovibrio ferrophilus]BBD09806.1 valyl-tRNA synthetase [Desulfovibrio ferrophilus]